jgi:hypothetical protein
MDTDLLKTLNAQIDRHAGGQPAGKLESHTLDTLCRRVLAPRPVVEKLLSSGLLQPTGPVHLDGTSGLYTFESDGLNAVREAVVRALVEEIVASSDGEPNEIRLATGDALNRHAASFAPAATKKEFARALGSGCVMLGRNPEDEITIDHGVRTGAAIISAGAARVASVLSGKRLHLA